MSKVKTAHAILNSVSGLITNKKVQKALFGEYADGTPRSLTDALDGEFLSPSQREKKVYKSKKKKKSKKSKRKNKIKWD